MTTNTTLRRAIRMALSTGAITAGAGVLSTGHAQIQEERLAGPPAEEIVVTGTRILRRDFEATSPVYTVGRDMLSDAGTPQIEQVLNELPQLVPSITTTSNNPSLGGQALVDLRGLGTERTLVLLDGQRLQPSTTSGEIDLNTIPTALIESIEVMTGGGSATYGSDAIGGVVNVRLRRDFEGIEIGAMSGITGESDGRIDSASLVIGGNFMDNRGNAVLMVGWDQREEIFAGEREFSRVAFGPQLEPLGSTTVPEGFFVPSGLNPPSQAAYDQVFGQYDAAPGQVPTMTWAGFNPDGTVFSRGLGEEFPGSGTVNFQGDTTDPGFNPDNYTYNYSPVNYLQLPLERRQIAAFGHLEVAPQTELYTRLMYTTYDAAQELAATPVSAGIGSTIPVTNPLIPDDLAVLLAGRPDPTEDFTFVRRVTEVGPRNATNDYDVMQMVVGARGDFQLGEQTWSWDIGGFWGRTNRAETQSGNVSRSRLQAAYDDPDALAGLGCVGFNPFGEGNISPECAAAIAIQAQNITVLTGTGLTAVATGPLVELPAGPMQIAFGAEYRRDRGEFRPDEFLASGDVVGFNAEQPVDGEIDVTEGFVELSIPLLAEGAGVNYLGLDAGYRYSDYNLAGSVNTYMAGLEYRPVEAVRLRGSYQRAIRAPNVFELFRPASESFPAFVDPCWNDSAERTGPDAAQVNALCQAQGAGLNFPQGNSQVRSLIGGNLDLEPESADTYTFGVVWQPPMFGQNNQLRLAVDWFQYRLDDVIDNIGANTIISRCFNAQGFNPEYDPNNPWCERFQRSAAGVAEDVQTFDENVGERNVDGVDLHVDFRRQAGPGFLDVGLAFTRLLNWEQQEEPGAPLTSQEGTIGIEVAETFPRWKGILGLGYALNNFDVRWSIRYIDGMDVVNNDAARSPVTDAVRPTVSSYTNHRLTGRWRVNDSINLMLGVDNLLDEEPPIYTSDSRAGIQANTDPSTYDVRGRRYFLSAAFNF